MMYQYPILNNRIHTGEAPVWLCGGGGRSTHIDYLYLLRDRTAVTLCLAMSGNSLTENRPTVTLCSSVSTEIGFNLFASTY
ncbi:hypothetical protein J6590_081593 [Homalodisca vitripennis]|nr:hypothetical protein J6590_081593 [Homalodisca vitripennis]